MHHLRRGHGAQIGAGLGNFVKGLGESGGTCATKGGQLHAPDIALEERSTELGLERLDMGGHRPRRNAQFACRRGKSAQPRRGLKGTQRIKRKRFGRRRGKRHV